MLIFIMRVFVVVPVHQRRACRCRAFESQRLDHSSGVAGVCLYGDSLWGPGDLAIQGHCFFRQVGMAADELDRDLLLGLEFVDEVLYQLSSGSHCDIITPD